MAKIKEQDRIPITKTQRATKFIFTGAKIGTNYLKHYSKRLVNPNLSREKLHQDNASDIYQSLSQLKGSALKVAQMLSMDKNLLPSAYQQQFAMAQYSAPPLSYPLVVKTFEQAFKRKPSQIFDSFTTSAVNAASMGQVHRATLNEKKLAVKIQYPGVSDTIKSDLAMVKPIALTMFKLNPVEYDEFIGEVQMRLIEEANYTLELERSQQLSKQCAHISNLKFPTYYPALSSSRILTMDWMEGQLLGEYLKTKRKAGTDTNTIGQAMWDFYHYQIHTLKTLHADPHPGNFIITEDNKLGVIDFGCVKVIPKDFYKVYFQLLDSGLLMDKSRKEKVFEQLHFIYPDDSARDRKFFIEVFTTLVELLGRPFHSPVFDFSESGYFESLFKFGEEIGTMKEFRQSSRARGVKDAVYINRTYYGLYNILHDLNAKVDTTSFAKPVK